MFRRSTYYNNYSHRLTTLSFCDKIIQMDQGIVAKIGSYEDLVLKTNNLNMKKIILNFFNQSQP